MTSMAFQYAATAVSGREGWLTHHDTEHPKASHEVQVGGDLRICDAARLSAMNHHGEIRGLRRLENRRAINQSIDGQKAHRW